MQRFLLASIVAALVLNSATAQPIPEDKIRSAAAKALRVVQKSQAQWYDKASCASCHHQYLPTMAFELARQRGIPHDVSAARESDRKSFSTLDDLDAVIQGADYIDDVDEGWKLLSASSAGIPPGLSITVAARFLARAQRSDGSWWSFDYRPPQSASPITTTAVCAKAIERSLPLSEAAPSLRKAREWLAKVVPLNTEDRTFQLLGLYWTSADPVLVTKASRALQKEQRADGGWSQMPHLSSDAYSTGEALYALHTAAGLATNDPIYQNGLRFLLNAQQNDGSWLVKSRLHPVVRISPESFNSGFPIERPDQFSSIAGTLWACQALMLATTRTVEPVTGRPAVAAKPKDDWLIAAVTGTVDDLKRALLAGLPAESATGKNTSLLMAVAHDPEKVKQVLGRGATVETQAESGFTALMVAARYPGNAAAVRQLLAAPVKKDRLKETTSALFLAAASGDGEIVRLLLAAGAGFEEEKILIKKFYQIPIVSAVRRGDRAMVDELLANGVKVDSPDDNGVTPLGWAVVNNRLDMAKHLVAKGANPNLADYKGATPLHYAASLESGDTTVLEWLLSQKAQRGLKDRQGRTALDLAKVYNHAAMVKILER